MRIWRRGPPARWSPIALRPKLGIHGHRPSFTSLQARVRGQLAIKVPDFLGAAFRLRSLRGKSTISQWPGRSPRTPRLQGAAGQRGATEWGLPSQLHRKPEEAPGPPQLLGDSANGFSSAAQVPEPSGDPMRQPGVRGQSSQRPSGGSSVSCPAARGTCLPCPQPVLCLHGVLLPALSSHHTLTWSLSSGLSP